MRSNSSISAPSATPAESDSCWATLAKLVARLDEKRPGDAVKLTVWRDGKQAELSATLKAAG